MSYLGSILACLLLLVSTCQANTGGLRASTGTQGKGLLSNAMVGLAAVAGFLFIVFILLIVKRIFFKKENRDEEEEHAPELCVVYENKALEMESPEEAKTTNL
ncbi:small integral membrane protein 24 isoform X1 [Ictalurus punctatus]|uniref:Small integral membrane protein 24 isoform X1 n=1 Tax=Ictalurus punctatus TaxID=7998 RepID=A0A979ETX8_ICTPU|nr:small integral membrane protein 24 isoform X1 [Ictalurus punctatus]